MGFFDRIENILGSREETIRSISKDIDFTTSTDDEALEWGSEVEIEQDVIEPSSSKEGLLSRFSKKDVMTSDHEAQKEVPTEPPKISEFTTWTDETTTSQGISTNSDVDVDPTDESGPNVDEESIDEDATLDTKEDSDESINIVDPESIARMDTVEKTSTPFILPDREPLVNSTQVFNYLNVRDYPDSNTILTVDDVESVVFLRDTPVGYNLSQVDLFAQGVKSSLLTSQEEMQHHEQVIATLVQHIIDTDQEKIEIEKAIVEREQELRNALQSGAAMANRNNELYSELEDAKRHINELEGQSAMDANTQATPAYSMPTSFDQSDDEVEDSLLNSPEINQEEER